LQKGRSLNDVIQFWIIFDIFPYCHFFSTKVNMPKNSWSMTSFMDDPRLNCKVQEAALIIRGLFICKFAYSHRQYVLVKNDNFLVKNGLFICEFRIRGPKWRNVSTVNNEGNLYNQCKTKSSLDDQILIFLHSNAKNAQISRFNWIGLTSDWARIILLPFDQKLRGRNKDPLLE